MKKLVIIIIGIFLCSCQTRIQREIPIFQELDLKINQIDLDSILLDKEYFSGVGFFSVGSSQLFFVDQVFSSVIAYNGDGLYEGTFLGKGDGPDEQNNIHGFIPYGLKGNHVVLDNFELVVFDKNFQKNTSYPIEWDYSESYHDMVNNPKGSMLGLYEIDWKSRGNNSTFLMTNDDEEVFFPITMSHPTLNGYTSEQYYEEVAIFGRYNLSKKKIVEGFGKRSIEYLNHRFIPNFDFSYFTERENEILVSFAIDPLIHVYGLDGNLKYKFGVEGKNLKTNYPKTSTIDEALDNYKLDLEKAGFYQFVYFDESSKLTFRTYFPEGIGKGFSRVQIYQENKLIGDVKAPERFRVIGKIDDHFYADGIVDELNDRMGIYKFRLDIK